MSFADQLRLCVPTATLLIGASAAFAGGTEVPFSELVPWGIDTVGQGDVPAIANELSVSRVSLGSRHGGIRLSNGTVAMWGDNNNGQTTVPTLGAGITFEQLELGAEHTIARLSDGTVIAWGYNIVGQTDVPDFGGLSALLVAAGSNHNLVKLSSNTVLAWGDGSDGQTAVPVGLVTGAQIATALAGGLDHSAALLDTGEIIAWGDNTDGETTVPVLDPGVLYVSVQCGNNFTVALTDADEVKVWGASAYTTLPTVVGTAVEAGGRFENAYIRSNLGNVYVFGDNTNTQSTVPNLRSYVLSQIAVGNRFLVAAGETDCDQDGTADRDEILADPTLDCDENGGLDSCAITEDATLDCNDNDLLDSCEVEGDLALDCNGNGKFDSCELAADGGDALDCDEDGTIDSCQIDEDAGLDCNEDGALDSCSPTATGVGSTVVETITAGTVVTATGTNRADAAFDVQVTVTAKADLNSYGEYFELRLNDTIISYMFMGANIDCTAAAKVETVLINKDLWNSLVEDDGAVELTITASANVSSLECGGSSAKVEASWLSDFSDCNNNGDADICELREGLVTDIDENGVPDSCENFPRGDIDRDRKSDVLLYNSRRREFDMRGVRYNPATESVTFSNSNVLPAYPRPDSGYSPIGVGDFDGDGYGDLLYRQSDQRGIQIKLMQEDTEILKGNPSSVTSRRVQLLAIVDFNADGTSDIVWQHSYSKDFFVWTLQGTFLRNEIQLGNATGYTFLGAGDIDADGDADFLFRNNQTNVVQARVFDEGVLETTTDLTDADPIASTWEPRGMGDFDGDGKADLVWRNRTTGELRGWFLDGTALASEGQFGTVSSKDYEVVGIADYNGDGRLDIARWRNTNLELSIWLMNGTDLIDEGLFVPDPKQRIVKP